MVNNWVNSSFHENNILAVQHVKITKIRHSHTDFRFQVDLNI